MSGEKLQWHPAFFAALHIEFGRELDMLELKESICWARSRCR